jgi:hypothetical protein
MKKDEYTKQLEEENEALKKRLEVADLKAECYDFIMSHAIHEPKYGGAVVSETDGKNIVLLVKAKINHTNTSSMKIANDMIEDKKMMQGHNKK